MANKARIDLRLDASVHQKLKLLADQGGLSLNQLLQGVARWASDHGHAGCPHLGPDGNIEKITAEPSVVWFGHNGPDDEEPVDLDTVAFVLDFSDRSAVRSPHDFMPGIE